MDFSQRDMFSRAFEFRRSLTTIWEQRRSGFQMSGCDSLLLSLIIDLEQVSVLKVDEDSLAQDLHEAFERSGRLARPVIIGSAKQGAELELTSCNSSDHEDNPDGLRLLYDLPDDLPLCIDKRCHDLRFTPLAFAFPAAWSSRMAWIIAVGTREKTADAQAHLSALFSRDELDPLFLLERQQSTRQAGRGTSPNPLSLAERCLELEQRVRELETSGLARYEASLGDATRRRRYDT